MTSKQSTSGESELHERYSSSQRLSQSRTGVSSGGALGQSGINLSEPAQTLWIEPTQSSSQSVSGGQTGGQSTTTSSTTSGTGRGQSDQARRLPMSSQPHQSVFDAVSDNQRQASMSASKSGGSGSSGISSAGSGRPGQSSDSLVHDVASGIRSQQSAGTSSQRGQQQQQGASTSSPRSGGGQGISMKEGQTAQTLDAPASSTYDPTGLSEPARRQ